MTITFSLKQGQIRTSSGPIWVPLAEFIIQMWIDTYVNGMSILSIVVWKLASGWHRRILIIRLILSYKILVYGIWSKITWTCVYFGHMAKFSMCFVLEYLCYLVVFCTRRHIRCMQHTGDRSIHFLSVLHKTHSVPRYSVHLDSNLKQYSISCIWFIGKLWNSLCFMSFTRLKE